MKSVLKIIALLLLFTVNVYSQDAVDKVIMLNGESKEGKVTSMGNESIKFVYKGETLEYDLKKSEINKVIFASGREEVFNKKKTTQQQSMSTPADRRNKLAVLPFNFTTNDDGLMSEDLSHRMQNHCVDDFKGDTSLITVQDPMETNALLARNNIDINNIQSVMPKDLAVMLGVEYIVYSTGNIVNKGSQTYGSEVSTYKDKDKYKNNSKGSTVTTNNSTTVINYNTTIEMRIYNDEGKNVYSDSKNSFGSSLDSYKATIKYLVKRTPFGSKRK